VQIKDLLVLWLSEKINNVIKGEDYAFEALRISLKRQKEEN